jgi:hypothetical protein
MACQIRFGLLLKALPNSRAAAVKAYRDRIAADFSAKALVYKVKAGNFRLLSASSEVTRPGLARVPCRSPALELPLSFW